MFPVFFDRQHTLSIWWVRCLGNIYEGRRFREDPAPTINEQGRTHMVHSLSFAVRAKNFADFLPTQATMRYYFMLSIKNVPLNKINSKILFLP